MELLQGSGGLTHVVIAAAKEIVGEHTGVEGRGVIVVVADSAHEGGVAGGEDGVALVLGVGAEEVEAHEVALRHRVGVG